MNPLRRLSSIVVPPAYSFLGFLFAPDKLKVLREMLDQRHPHNLRRNFSRAPEPQKVLPQKSENIVPLGANDGMADFRSLTVPTTEQHPHHFTHRIFPCGRQFNVHEGGRAA